MSGTTTQRIGLWIEALDLLFFRDGRPFEAGSSVRSGLPSPLTLAGALRTFLLRRAGCDFDRLSAAMTGGASFDEAVSDGQPSAVAAIASASFRGPWLAIGGPQDVAPYIAAPAVLQREKSDTNRAPRLVRLAPLESRIADGLATTREGLTRLWTASREPSEAVNGWLSLDGLRSFLSGGVPDSKDVVPTEQLFGHQQRTGIGIDEQRSTARDGAIYSVAMLALKGSVGFYAEVSAPPPVVEAFASGMQTLPFGGEHRCVTVQVVAPVVWPEPDLAPNARRLVLLTSPGFFDEGWKPSILRCTAAAVPAHEAFSGWDLALRAPRPTRFAAAAGSVYFLEAGAAAPASLCAPDDARIGFGSYLTGSY